MQEKLKDCATFRFCRTMLWWVSLSGTGNAGVSTRERLLFADEDKKTRLHR